MYKDFDKAKFVEYMEKHFNGFSNSFLRELIENIIDYALKNKQCSKDQFVYFISDLLPEVEFGEVAMFMSDNCLTNNGQQMKYDFMVDVKAGYYEFDVFLGDDLVYTFDGDGLSEKITDETGSEQLSDIVDDCIYVMKDDFKNAVKEIPFNNVALAALKRKMINCFAEHFSIKK